MREGMKQRNTHVAYPVQSPKEERKPAFSAPDPWRELPPRLLGVILMVGMCVIMVFYPAYTVNIPMICLSGSALLRLSCQPKGVECGKYSCGPKICQTSLCDGLQG